MFFIRNTSDVVKTWQQSWTRFTTDVDELTKSGESFVEFLHPPSEKKSCLPGQELFVFYF